MKLKVLVFEDDEASAQAIINAVRESTLPIEEIKWVNPVSDDSKPMTFEVVHDLIEGFELVLLDHQLGSWKFTGSHIAASCEQSVLVSISSEERPWTDHCFTEKAKLVISNDRQSKALLIKIISLALKQSPLFPPGYWEGRL